MATMASKILLFLLALVVSVNGQTAGSNKVNSFLNMAIEECTGKENCNKVSTKVTLDANWRWIHEAGGTTNCYDGNIWDNSFCPDPATCNANCEMEGCESGDWSSTYGVSASGTDLSLTFVTTGQYSTNIGSRNYLMDTSGTNYYMFKLKNKEFTFDVDNSQLPCGLNGALYFVEMQKDGGLGAFPGNKVGAAFGTGYCDAQCPHDVKYINGEPNSQDWIPSETDANAGFGHFGSCCYELDIWEANEISTVFTPHPCDTVGQERCEGTPCGDNKAGERYDGVCDKDGCDFNSWRMGDRTFYGPGSSFKLDSSKTMTVVTQFLTSDGTDSGDLAEIRRVYLQDGQVIYNSFTNVPGIDPADSITDEMCGQQKVAFGDPDDHAEKGGLKAMGESMDRGHVLVMSMWDDHDAHMLWLDSDFPLEDDPSTPGVSRGSCPRDSGVPADMEANFPSASIKFANIRIGEIGSTFPGGDTTPPTPRPTDGPTKPTNPGPTTSHGPGPTNPPTQDPNTCPGGSLGDCIAMCPPNPPEIFQGCVMECTDKCS